MKLPTTWECNHTVEKAWAERSGWNRTKPFRRRASTICQPDETQIRHGKRKPTWRLRNLANQNLWLEGWNSQFCQISPTNLPQAIAAHLRTSSDKLISGVSTRCAGYRTERTCIGNERHRVCGDAKNSRRNENYENWMAIVWKWEPIMPGWEQKKLS